MATTTTITSAYAGSFAQEYIFAALLSADTLDKGVVTVKENVKPKGVTVKRLETNKLMGDSTCDWAPTSTITLDDRKLTVKKLQINVQQCVEEFEGDWDAESMGDSAWTNLPPAYLAALRDYILERIGQENEENIWEGTEGAGTYDGFLTLMDGDATINRVEGVGPVTKANVIGEMDKVYNAIPNRLKKLREGSVMAVSYEIASAYQQALSGFGTAGLGSNGFRAEGTVGEKPYDYLGWEIVPLAGLPERTMVVYPVSELWFGTGKLADWDRLNIVDTRQTLNDQNLRLASRFYAGCQYAFGKDIVLYEDTVS